MIDLKSKLCESIPTPYKLEKIADLFGFEIELEGFGIYHQSVVLNEIWRREADGSLRQNAVGSQCCEYVLRKPLDYVATITAIEALFQFLNTPPCLIFKSYRTSIHVHINCMEETIMTILNFITLAVIFDELFVSQNGETRIGNNFCLRSRDAEGQISSLVQSIKIMGSIFNVNATLRYSSVNIVSLTKYGTIEFRSLECTTDLKRVVAWIDVIQGLKAAARAYSNPREIIVQFSRLGPVGFMLKHLGAQYPKYAQVPGAHKMLKEGMRLAQDLAYCFDWENPDDRLLSKKPTKPKVNQIPAWQLANEPPAPVPPQPEDPDQLGDDF
jgi:hypothetical protein